VEYIYVYTHNHTHTHTHTHTLSNCVHAHTPTKPKSHKNTIEIVLSVWMLFVCSSRIYISRIYIYMEFAYMKIYVFLIHIHTSCRINLDDVCMQFAHTWISRIFMCICVCKRWSARVCHQNTTNMISSKRMIFFLGYFVGVWVCVCVCV